MAWTVKITLDNDKVNVGSVSMTYTDPLNPALQPITYTQRVSLDENGVIEMVAAANAFLHEKNKSLSSATLFSNALTKILNDDDDASMEVFSKASIDAMKAGL